MAAFLVAWLLGCLVARLIGARLAGKWVTQPPQMTVAQVSSSTTRGTRETLGGSSRSYVPEQRYRMLGPRFFPLGKATPKLSKGNTSGTQPSDWVVQSRPGWIAGAEPSPFPGQCGENATALATWRSLTNHFYGMLWETPLCPIRGEPQERVVSVWFSKQAPPKNNKYMLDMFYSHRPFRTEAVIDIFHP